MSISRNKADASWWHRHHVPTNAAGGVPAAGITAGGAQFAGLIDLPSWWRAAVQALVTSFNWLTAPTALPNWMLTGLWLALAAWIAALIALAVAWLRTQDETPAFDLHSYTRDTFFNLIWRWQWAHNGPDVPVPLCHICDMQIFPRHGYGAGVVGRTEFFCKERNMVQYSTEDSHTGIENLKQEVVLRVQRKLRAQLAGHERVN